MGCTLITEYPIIKHESIAVVMNISHLSDCAMMCHGNIKDKI